MALKPANEQEIIHRCQQGDVSAFKIVYEHFEQPLLRVALHMLGQKQDAEDAVQVTFIKLFRSVGHFAFESKFSTYLFRILLNVCYDALARRGKMSLLQVEDIVPVYHANDDLRLQLEEAIAALPAKMRACFVLFAIEELKQSEIAAILNLSIGAVKSNIFHAKNKLRAMLSDNTRGIPV